MPGIFARAQNAIRQMELIFPEKRRGDQVHEFVNKTESLSELIKRNRKNYAGSQITPHIQGKGATLVPGTLKFLHHRKKKMYVRIRRIAGLT
jgi:hypothetical protein